MSHVWYGFIVRGTKLKGDIKVAPGELGLSNDGNTMWGQNRPFIFPVAV